PSPAFLPGPRLGGVWGVAEPLPPHPLEGLGRGLGQAAISCDVLLEQAIRSSDSTRGLMFITPEEDPEILHLAAARAKRAGVPLWTATGQEESVC
ncbi:MAG: hypothetical protein LUF00_11245, partial [Lachnospiraceae bacterium]|nr:hypothetical protein [Lachnospiraceae bacterium]